MKRGVDMRRPPCHVVQIGMARIGLRHRCCCVDVPPFDHDRPETATNRDMTVLRVDSEAGPFAAIWPAVRASGCDPAEVMRTPV